MNDLKRLYPRHPKDRGQWAELLFMATAARLGLNTCKPYGDNARYDVIVEAAGNLHRVQIKCTNDRRQKAFNTRCSCYQAISKQARRAAAVPSATTRCLTGQPRRVFTIRRYTKRDVDFIAVYVIPEDSWFIIPIEHIHSTFLAVPQKNGSRRLRHREQFREAWHLLGAPSGLALHAAAEASSIADDFELAQTFSGRNRALPCPN